MAGFFQQAFQSAKAGFFNDAYLRDFRHASKTFVQDGYSNAPKFKWLFHVYFDLNDQLTARDVPITGNHGLLVKNITLPKFGITVAEMNQYNRKRYVQTKHTYDPVSITFHDDNAGLIKKMWYDYYTYYYGDTTTASINKAKLNISNIYAPDNSDDNVWGYIDEPSTSSLAATFAQPKPPFFKSIKIYGFDQHNFSEYTLNNPIIERFDHDTYDYYQTSSTMENRMTIRYESVGYAEGKLNGQNPGALVSGFGDEGVYDTLLSPISKPGGNKTIMGQGGLFDAGAGILDDLGSGNIMGAAAKALNVAHTWKNPKEVLSAAKGSLVTGALTVAADPALSKKPFTFVSAQADKINTAIAGSRKQPPNP